jgi:hypothetical protein
VGDLTLAQPHSQSAILGAAANIVGGRIALENQGCCSVNCVAARSRAEPCTDIWRKTEAYSYSQKLQFEARKGGQLT